LDGSLSLVIDILDIMDASVNVSKAFGINGSLQDTSNDLLNLFGISELFFLILTKNSLSSSLSDVDTKVVPVMDIVGRDGRRDLGVNLSVVDNKISSNVIGKRSWALEDSGHLSELFPVGLDVRAV